MLKRNTFRHRTGPRGTPGIEFQDRCPEPLRRRGVGTQIGTQRLSTGWDETGSRCSPMVRRPHESSCFRRKRYGLGRQIMHFETAPFGEATADHVVIRALHAGSFSVAHPTDSTSGVALLHKLSSARRSPRGAMDQSPPVNDQPCVITTLPKWPRPSKWR
jgi:hypothetical protein